MMQKGDAEAATLSKPVLPPKATNHRPNLIDGPIRSVLLRIAWPVLGEQVLNTFVGMFDVFLAGRISAAATSAVGLGAYVAWLGSMLVMLVGTGATAIIARHAGGRDYEGANRFANQAMILAAILGSFILVAMYVLAPLFARYANLSGETHVIATDYVRVDAVGHLFLSITLVACACLRGIGDTRTPMLIFVAINGVNAAVSWLLVYGLGPIPAYGIRGIVMGTVCAQVVGSLIAVFVLVRGGHELRLMLNQMSISWERVARILRIGLPAAVDGAVIWTGHFLFLAIISHVAPPPRSEIILAAHIIAIRVEALTYLPAFAYGTATATMIGHALGANLPRRAYRAGFEALIQCELIALTMAAVFYFCAELIYRLMSNDPQVVEAGVGPFRVLALFQPCLALSIVLIGGLRGAGDTRFPLLISLVGSMLIRVSIGYFFGIVLRWGLMGAWMGMFADMLWRALAATIRFARGHWISVRV